MDKLGLPCSTPLAASLRQPSGRKEGALCFWGRRTGWIDGGQAMMERLIGFKHAGTDMLRCAGGREAGRSMRFRLSLF